MTITFTIQRRGKRPTEGGEGCLKLECWCRWIHLKHQWLEHIPVKYWLIAMIDDATSKIPYARFFPSDTMFANIHVIRRFIEICGLFITLYVDKASHFETTRHGGLHYPVR